MPANESLPQLVAQMPDPDRRGMLTENYDKEKTEQTVAALAAGGQASVLGLVAMLAAPGTADDAKPHFALHLVVNHSLVSKNESLRKEICTALASQLENPQVSAVNRTYLCQELQWAGRDEACPALGRAVLNADLSDAATAALVAIGGERAAAPLRAAAANAQGRVRLNVIHGLAALADPQASALFGQALLDTDAEVRLAAAAGLARIGQAESADQLLKTAAAAQGWERTKLTSSCLVLAERLAAAGNKLAARKIYQQLQASRSGENERHIREAAERGLAALA